MGSPTRWPHRHSTSDIQQSQHVTSLHFTWLQGDGEALHSRRQFVTLTPRSLRLEIQPGRDTARQEGRRAGRQAGRSQDMHSSGCCQSIRSNSLLSCTAASLALSSVSGSWRARAASSAADSPKAQGNSSVSGSAHAVVSTRPRLRRRSTPSILELHHPDPASPSSWLDWEGAGRFKPRCVDKGIVSTRGGRIGHRTERF